MTTVHDNRIKIDPEVRDFWATRLTDETYAQLREALTAGWKEEADGKGHAEQACCLGVLTGCAIEKGVEDVRWDPQAPGVVQIWDEDEAANDPENDEAGWVDFSDADLPYVVSKWAFGGVSENNPILRNDGYGDGRAIYLNDDLKLDFAEIAALVRDLPVLPVQSDELP